jgi:hypothetical protein
MAAGARGQYQRAKRGAGERSVTTMNTRGTALVAQMHQDSVVILLSTPCAPLCLKELPRLIEFPA